MSYNQNKGRGIVERLWASIREILCREESESCEEQKPVEQEAKKRNEEPAYTQALERIAEEIKSRRKEANSEGDRKYFIDKWATGGIIAAAVVGLLAILESYCSNHHLIGAMNQQLDEMKSEQRPWVSADVITGNILWDETGLHIPITMTLQNTGHQPAMHVVVQPGIGNSFSPDNSGNPHFAAAKIAGQLRDNKVNGFPLFPAGSYIFEKTAFLSRDEIGKYVKSRTEMGKLPTTMPVVLYYIIDYRNGSNEIHHQTFCAFDVKIANPEDPQGEGFPQLFINKNIAGSDVRLRPTAIDCGAD